MWRSEINDVELFSLLHNQLILSQNRENLNLQQADGMIPPYPHHGSKFDFTSLSIENEQNEHMMH